MFAVFPPSPDSTIEIRDHAVKDRQFFRYKAKPDLVIKPDQKIGSTLSLEEHQPCIRLVRLSQDKQINGVRQFVNKKLQDFWSVPGAHTPSLRAATERQIAVVVIS